MAAHGEFGSLTQFEELRSQIRTLNETLAFEAFEVQEPTPFTWLFGKSAFDPSAKLTSSPVTFDKLVALGRAMTEPGQEGNSSVPAWMTYLGQFIDHDITAFLAANPVIRVLGETDNNTAQPISPADAASMIKNERTPHFDLDSVYEGLAAGPAARIGDKFRIGPNSPVVVPGQAPPLEPVPGKSKGPDGNFDHDLPRVAKVAQIGDKRNDENLIIAQLHLAFLKFHNALVDRGLSFEDAQKAVRQHYQWIVIKEYLPAICDQTTVAKVLQGQGPFSKMQELAMPIEFAFAGFRFGHTMIRNGYDYNNNFPRSTLAQLFTFTQLSGTLVGQEQLVDNWIIQWHRFVDFNPAAPTNNNPSRHFDTRLAEELARLTAGGAPEPGNRRNLAVRNLIRGYLVNLPIAQAIAAELVAAGLMNASDVLTANELTANAQGTEQTALTDGGFDTRTPLWYYILAEAKIRTGGDHLGPLGSWIVAGTIVALIARTPDSILAQANWAPTLGPAPGIFRFADLLRVAGVADTPTGALA